MGAAMGVRKRAAPKAVPVAVPVYDASIARAFDRELPRTPRGTVDVRAARGEQKVHAFEMRSFRARSGAGLILNISSKFRRRSSAPRP